MRHVRLPVRLILLGVVAAQLADAVSFRVAIESVGIGAEANPVAQALFRAAGPDGVLAVKLVATTCAVVLLAVLASRFRRLLVLGGATATSIGLLGAVSNVVALIDVHALAG
jgi:hypothetical protein